MDYGFSDKRKSKNDKKAKGRYNRFKKGGQFRTSNVSISNDRDKNKS
ncbi:MAG: hypothetical protein WCK29_03225 [archaeon]